MTDSSHSNWFDHLDVVVADPLKFKAKLAIGEDAYTSLKLKNTAFEALDILGAATTAASIAKSSAVASYFFGGSGLLTALGLTTATTPIGWVIAAGTISGAAWFGMARYLKQFSKERVTVIPEFLNTPLDVLGVSLFGFLAPLALKVAVADEEIADVERDKIRSYFVKTWGFDSVFVDAGLEYTESNLARYEITSVADVLAAYQKDNPDCNYKRMCEETIAFLHDILEADGRADPREVKAIETIRSVFEVAALNTVERKYKIFADTMTESMNSLRSKMLPT